ncbi:DNA primase [Mumia sp. zg.B21]|uniref:DNA primase n=1 Tax=unclassified Mumia TaxID=2621872 RepID=UPI001C6E3FF2|nr:MULTISPECIES: DNA primase [unclassified Mumia]MBW9211321.1 DNA primase [Mumia sp. zg.B21]MDD9348046.1 DNA primase [Mumia sp.]
MAGRIREDDIAAVRERARIDEIVEQYVTLRNAGGGSRKGLCPFHDEKSPSFNVTPSRGMYYCFGCGEGGDVFTFLQKIDQISFSEAVERLAAKYAITLTYVDGPAGPQRDFAQRGRLVAANAAAEEFYSDQLASDKVAVKGRQFLSERGFSRDAAERFGVGFAPRDGEALYRHLRGRGFADDDLVAAGLVARGNRGPYDRFRGRLMWPIRDASGDVVGFGARRLFDDDRIEAKYLNTPETPLYKKSQVLYGVDLARKAISKSSQAVVVEGYTDVMACHEAGVGTAVATCGTAFGEEHARVLRRLLLDHEAMRGEVIFTFDGDEAGQKAAMRAFEGDAQFVAQTYVAVQPDGLDPCDVRLHQGDAAVQELVASRIPLYRFVLRNVVARYDLDHADQRVDALRSAVELVSAVRDQGKVEQFVREIASTVGVELDEVRRELGEARRRPAPRPATRTSSSRGAGRSDEAGATDGASPTSGPAADEPVAPVPSLGEQRFTDERELLKVLVQHPHLLAPYADALDDDVFTHPYATAIWSAAKAEGLPSKPDDAWAARVRDRLGDPQAQRTLAHLSVDPLPVSGVPDAALVVALAARVQELAILRRIAAVKSRLQRTDPLESTADYNAMFGDLVALEQQRRQLRERAIGGSLA